MKKICWITPDYFMCADAFVVPELTKQFDIEWITINTYNSRRKSDGLINGHIKPEEINLKYRQKDPRIIFQFIKLLFKIRKSNPDLIYLSFHGLPYFFPLFFLLIDAKKVIYGAHNVSTPKGASNEKFMRIYHDYVYKRIHHFHVFSEFQLGVIQKMLPKKVHYYAPLALEDFGPSNVSAPVNVIRFLFFGYIREYKRLDLLLTSFQELYEMGYTNIELNIAGNCENWEKYQLMIKTGKGINLRIEIVPNNDIPDIISSCHYVVLPYQDGAQSAVLPLAYQYNKPVIVSDIEAFRQFVVEGETGFYFTTESSDSLTQVMKNVIVDHHINYERLKLNTKEYVEREFSTDRIINRYKSFLSDCIQGRSALQSVFIFMTVIMNINN